MYKPINGWTKELMINAIVQGNKGRLSVNVNNACMYRGMNGNKCAIGCFIPDELYHSSCEAVAVTKLLRDFSGLVDFMPLPEEGLYRLQGIHDDLVIYRDFEVDPRPALIQWINNNVE